MGLSGPKRRTKLSSDPNNTTWSKSTDGFGHKMLAAQGWKPGQLLGAKDAAHAEHFTAANASHIRVMLREDNLGLGAQLGKSNAGSFGLSTLSGIFGRLNGKSDEDVEKQQSAQRDVELRAYQTQKFGYMTFVRGGLLIGDKMEEDGDQTSVLLAKPKKAADNEESVVKSKRKRGDDDKDEREDKKKRRSQKEVTAMIHDQSAAAAAVAQQNTDTLQENEKAAKAARKAEKRARKEQRQQQKEERREKRAERRAQKAVTSEDSTSSDAGTEEKTTTTTTQPKANPFAGRQAVRQRWIQQKRLASMDARALNEILMMKPVTTQ